MTGVVPVPTARVTPTDALLALPYALKLIPRLRREASGVQLNLLLGATAKLGLLLGLLLSVGVFM